ncbi:hypothetical protein AMK05_CH02950 [Rhizobium sp. N324]|nr:hypothetical protein AMK05_CH02950 [Rhizobium sp. N324]OYD04920.1 hypothetical protein AMK08_CH102967 [Rhizobium sp. N4311]
MASGVEEPVSVGMAGGSSSGCGRRGPHCRCENSERHRSRIPTLDDLAAGEGFSRGVLRFHDLDCRWYSSQTRPLVREALLNAPPVGAETDARSWLLFDRVAALIERWRGGKRPVFLDFGDAEFPLARMSSTGVLWWLSYALGGRVIATPVDRQSVVDHMLSGTSIRGFGRPMPPMSRRSGRPRF